MRLGFCRCDLGRNPSVENSTASHALEDQRDAMNTMMTIWDGTGGSVSVSSSFLRNLAHHNEEDEFPHSDMTYWKLDELLPGIQVSEHPMKAEQSKSSSQLHINGLERRDTKMRIYAETSAHLRLNRELIC